MRLLAIDTSSAQCSATLLLDGRQLVRGVMTARDHARLLLPLVDELLQEAGIVLGSLDGIAFGCGPGSFTGLRIAAAVTQGLAAGANLPVLPVSSLRALAEQARAVERQSADHWLLACMDARMGEVYWGLFRDEGAAVAMAVGGERLGSPDAVAVQLRALMAPGEALRAAAGMGLGAYPSLCEGLDLPAGGRLPQAEPHAAQIAMLAAADLQTGRARWLDAAEAQPVYLRDRVVQVSHSRPGL